MDGPTIQKAHIALFRTRYMRPKLNPQPADMEKPERLVAIEPSIIVMSRETERQIMYEDYSGISGLTHAYDKTTPRRLFGIRVAYDDTLEIGRFLVGEVLND